MNGGGHLHSLVLVVPKVDESRAVILEAFSICTEALCEHCCPRKLLRGFLCIILSTERLIPHIVDLFVGRWVFQEAEC